jgi:hypothetical protein
MGVLFTLTALTFEPSPAQLTIFSVAAVMYIGAAVGFILALRAGK